MTRPPPDASIAVVGVSALFPGSSDASGFWRDILAGRDLMTDVPPSHWLIEDYYDPNPDAPDKTYGRRGAFLGAVDFDPMEFGIPPNNLPATDTAQLLALIVAQKVLADATQGQFEGMNRERVSVILGVTSAQELLSSMVGRLQKPVWLKGLRESGIAEDQAQQICQRIADHYLPWQEATFPGLLGNVVAGRIANRFDLRGTNCVVDAACASSLAAVSMAVQELVCGGSDLVITGGVDTMNDIFMYMCFSKTPALSRTGDCRPFADDADGTMLGEGLAMFALKRLADAERDGDRIYAVLRGLGSSSDGRSKSVYAPLPDGQARALRRAYERAGYGPDTVELMEAHGTGTMAGDTAELEGLRTVFQESGRPDPQWCALGSIKSQVGHTKAAAGAAGLFKAIMALRHGVLPPTIKVRRPHARLELDTSPFYLSTEARPWIRGNSHPRRASVSSFGFGGSNFHATLEEYTGPGRRAKRLRTSPVAMVLIGAATRDELLSRCQELAREAIDDDALLHLAYRSQTCEPQGAPHRLALVASSAQELRTRLMQVGDLPSHPSSGQIAFLFPGQGSQYIGMGADLAIGFEAARAAWDRAARWGEPHRYAFPVPSFHSDERDAQVSRLTATQNAQPAIAAASLALLELLRRVGVVPDCVAGHSFGEITALHAAGVLDADSLLAIARRRGELMAAERGGAMLAVKLPLPWVREILARGAGDIVVANHNHATQVVLSGPLSSIAALEAQLLEDRIAARRLQVSAAFHSPLVAGAARPFGEFLAEIPFSSPRCDVYGNADAEPYPAAPEIIRSRLASHLIQPVRFMEQIEAMHVRGVRTFIEVGPGSVLTDLVHRILDGRDHDAIALDRRGTRAEVSFWEGLARLYMAGVPLALAPLWEDQAVPPEPAARKTPAISIAISGTNVGKPYPPAAGAKALPPPNPTLAEAARAAPAVTNGEAARIAPAAVTNGEVARTAPAPVTNGAPAPESAVQLAWLSARQELQRQAADAHGAFQRTLSESHTAYLRLVEGALQSGAAAPSLPAVTMREDTGLPMSLPAVVIREDAGLPVSAPELAWSPAVTRPEPNAAATPPVAPAKEARVDLQSLLMAVVADRTGYPVEMLAPNMDLEADLGIDSIKRVEILSAIHERAPELPQVDAATMASLRTLGDVIAHLDAAAPVHSREAPNANGAAATFALAHGDAAIDVHALIMDVVADRTGYPAEMLKIDMDLEADLGIDSIKRVEILSSLRERAPGLPEVDGATMAALRTLRDVIGHLAASQPSVSSPRSAPPAPAAAVHIDAHRPAPTAPLASEGARDLRALLMDVVADRTGYPAEMLKTDMDLEADLGIDSIKRVEILSSLRERAPELPEVDGATMAKLRTLGDVLAHLGPSTTEYAPSASAPSLQPKAVPATTLDLPAVATAHSRPERFVVRQTPRPAPGFAVAGLRNGLVITDDGGGIARCLASRLRARGLDVAVVDQAPADATGVIFLGGLRPVPDVAAAIAIQRDAFATARQVARCFEERGGVFVTVQDTGGYVDDEGGATPRTWLAGVSALARTVAREWPQASVKAIDLERGDRSAEALAEALERELTSGGGTLEVALRADGHRTTPQTVPLDATPGKLGLDDRSVLIATGGGRGVTAAALIELARETRAHIALFGRTTLCDEPPACRGIDSDSELKRILLELAHQEGRRPSPAELGGEVARILAVREISNTLRALQAAGAAARYVSVDICDAAAVANAVALVRRTWGPITGIIHGAGVIADKRVSDKTPAQFDAVFDTKVEGLRGLLAATVDDPLSVLLLFSSVSACFGNPGQCDYAMANETLNRVAAAEQRRRGGRCLVRSIDWGPWAGGMVTPALRAHFLSQGVPLLPLDDGARALVDEIGTLPSDDVEVVIAAPGTVAAWQSGPERSIVEIQVDATTHPYLDGHRIHQKPVVPIALAVEWMLRGAQALVPDLRLRSCHHVQVLRGIPIDRFASTGARLVMECRRRDAASITVELRSSAGAVHYRGAIDIDPQAVAPPPESSLPLPTGVALARSELYDGDVLFHGPAFQVLDSSVHISDEGSTGMVRGVRGVGWPGDHWAADVAAIDGGLQLAVLWARRALGGATLPTGIGHYRHYGADVVSDRLRVVVRKRVAQPARALCDIDFVADQRLIAELRDVELHLRPERPSRKQTRRQAKRTAGGM